MKRLVPLLIVLLSFSFLNTTAQDSPSGEDSKFFIGVNFGGYFANKNTTPFYNGFAGDSADVNGIERVIIFNHWNYNRIRDEVLEYDFVISEFPTDMKYRPGISIGLHTGVNLNEYTSIILDADFVNLKIVDAFTLEVLDPGNQTSQPIYYTASLLGKERRLNLNLGVHGVLGEGGGSVEGFFEAGVNLNSTIVETNEVIIDHLNYLILFQNNPFFPKKYGGLGYGFFGGLGMHFDYSDKFKFELGVNVFMKRIKLSDNEAAKELNKFRLNELVYLRMILG
jgi:hypothetical protein